MEDQLSALPKDLDEMYERTLLRCSDRLELKQILLWLAFSTEPLRLEQLADVVTVSFSPDGLAAYDASLRYFTPSDVLATCSSFVIELEGAFSVKSMRCVILHRV